MPRKSFLLRIDQKLFDDLESWAQQEMRSVNGQVEYLLRQAIMRYKGTSSLSQTQSETSEVADTKA